MATTSSVSAVTFTGGVRPYAPSYGDTVIIAEGPQEFAPVLLKRGGKVENRFGAFFHSELVAARYGSKVYSKSRNGGFVHMLPFTPELWTHALTHRTQILFSVDIAMVVTHLCLRPGSVVIESGTGSGSLTTTLARAVAPHGHVHTFEFNADRARKAVEDFARNGMGGVVTVAHRDVCEQGFGGHLAGRADGVFLDLPQPWLALPHAHGSLRRGGVLCSFSPCIEQVQRTAEALRGMGFDDIRTVETLLRPYEVSSLPGNAVTPPPVLDVFGAAAAVGSRAAGTAGSNGAQAGDAPSAKRPRTEASAQPQPSPVSASADTGANSDGGGDAGEDDKSEGGEDADVAMVGAPSSTHAVDDAPAALDPAQQQLEIGSSADRSSSGAEERQSDSPFPPLVPFPAPNPSQRMSVTPSSFIRGHTAYLTFATLHRKLALPPAAVAAIVAPGTAAAAAAAAEARNDGGNLEASS